MRASLVSSARWTTPGHPRARPVTVRAAVAAKRQPHSWPCGDAALATADFRDAAVRYGRVVGFDDAAITAAALLGLGEARYRLGDDDAALASWEAAVKVGETPSTYPAWRNVAAARVRNGDLAGAIEAYRQADRRAPPEDKPEIATRLGWLTKESATPEGGPPLLRPRPRRRARSSPSRRS